MSNFLFESVFFGLGIIFWDINRLIFHRSASVVTPDYFEALLGFSGHLRPHLSREPAWRFCGCARGGGAVGGGGGTRRPARPRPHRALVWAGVRRLVPETVLVAAVCFPAVSSAS